MLAALERAREAEQRFVGDASHELRTPLTALRGNVAYVARHGADPEVLADLEADAERLGVLLDDLLALAREDAAAPAAASPSTSPSSRARRAPTRSVAEPAIVPASGRRSSAPSATWSTTRATTGRRRVAIEVEPRRRPRAA